MTKFGVAMTIAYGGLDSGSIRIRKGQKIWSFSYTSKAERIYGLIQAQAA
jgi:hypothetical protein